MSYYNNKASEGYNNNAYDMSNTGGYRDEPTNGGYGGQNNGSYASVGNGSEYPMSGPAASAGSPYAYQPEKKKRNKWLWIGLPLLLLAIIIAAVVGGVVGSRKSGNDNNTSTSGSNNNNAASSVPATNSDAGVGSTATGANGNVIFAVATDSYQLPVYPTGTATSGYTAPTAIASAKAAWPTDPDSPSTSSPRAHPRLIAPQYKWDALTSSLVAADPYMKQWNASIMAEAQANYTDPPLTYDIDGGLSGSGVLDVSRRLKVKVKNWSYAYRMTQNTKWSDRVWAELQNCATFGDGNTRWNPQHFLDVAEFSAAYAIAYDWLYEIWSDDQKTQIRGWIIDYGLTYGQQVYNGTADTNVVNNWWANLENGDPIAGNWNCVCNGGLTMASLAILGDDTTGIAEYMLNHTVPNAKANCFLAVRDDGTWAETSDYWYFGNTGAAEMVSSLTTAYGDDQGILEGAPQWNLSSVFHIYIQGMTSKFNWGDNGPNKYSSTANPLFLWASEFEQPRYALFQRDQHDASTDPWSMFWYNPALDGAWWDNLPLDNHFNDTRTAWGSMRSTWTDNNGVFVAMKSPILTGHQTHGDLDIGDFVIDALGQRFVGEYGSGQYLSTDYFSSEAQDSERWTYYNKMTEGQNTLMLDYANQLVSANVTSVMGSTGEAQGAAPGYTVPEGSTAYYMTDMTSAYTNTTGPTFLRGIRMINDRKQVLLQDDVAGATQDVQWRVQTNATITLDDAKTTATFELGGQTLSAKILSPTSGAEFSTLPSTKLASDPASPTEFVYNGVSYDGNPPHPNVTVLAITMAGGGGGNFSLQVVFNPSWGSGFTAITPPSVPLTEWTTTSHNN